MPTRLRPGGAGADLSAHIARLASRGARRRAASMIRYHRNGTVGDAVIKAMVDGVTFHDLGKFDLDNQAAFSEKASGGNSVGIISTRAWHVCAPRVPLLRPELSVPITRRGLRHFPSTSPATALASCAGEGMTLPPVTTSGTDYRNGSYSAGYTGAIQGDGQRSSANGTKAPAQTKQPSGPHRTASAPIATSRQQSRPCASSGPQPLQPRGRAGERHSIRPHAAALVLLRQSHSACAGSPVRS